MPTFSHAFTPTALSPAGAQVDLDIAEIEAAGILEILQAPGAALGSWSVLGALLEPIPQFQFKEPLGKSREVKTALSGLFGRFVARAYANRYLQLAHFDHIYASPMVLSGASRGVVQRVPGDAGKGDFPDWVARSLGGRLAIVEAKGCHDRGGPQAALGRAYRQAQRVEIRIGGRRARFKRYAIATRWGCAVPTSTASMLHVRDPEVEGEVGEHEIRELGLGIARRHLASMLRGLGHAELSTAVLELVGARSKQARDEAIGTARSSLDNAAFREATRLETGAPRGPQDVLLGGMITRGGPIPFSEDLTQQDQERLMALNLRPTFVGLERRSIAAIIAGDLDKLESIQIEERLARPETRTQGPLNDLAGGWVIRLEEDRVRLA